MRWLRNVLIFSALAGCSVGAIVLLETYLPPNCSTDGEGYPFVIRLFVSATLPITIHLLMLATFIPRLSIKMITVITGIFHAAVIIPFFIMVTGLVWLMGTLGKWEPFARMEFFGAGYLLFMLLPPVIVAIVGTLWLVKQPLLSYLSGNWGRDDRVLFLFIPGAAIWALGTMLLVNVFGCL